MKRVVPVFFDFEELHGHWPDAPKGRTRREIVAMRKGLPVFRGVGKAKMGLSAIEAIELAEQLPPPVFNADRRFREADLLDLG
jgi:tRNA (guanine-N7-)-methyltransferase